jgi:hypothetical protein
VTTEMLSSSHSSQTSSASVEPELDDDNELDL